MESKKKSEDRKRKKKESDARYAATRIGIGLEIDRWIDLKTRADLKTHAEVAKLLLDQMKITKNDWRSSLNSSSLSDLMLIHSETQSVEEFDPMDSIVLWNSSGTRARRPFYNEKVKPVKVTHHSLNIDTDDVFLIAEELDMAKGGVCDDHEDDDDDSVSDDEDYMHRQDLIALQNRAYKLMMDLVE